MVLDAHGRVLLHRRLDNGRWGLPGGGIERGETAEQAVVREVREETGEEVEAERLVGVYSDPELTSITYPDGNTVAYVALAFGCRVLGGAPALSDETLEVGWRDALALPDSVTPGHRERIRDALEGNSRASSTWETTGPRPPHGPDQAHPAPLNGLSAARGRAGTKPRPGALRVLLWRL